MGKATYVTGLEYLSRRYNDNRMEAVERREGFTRFDALLENGHKGRIDAYTLLPGMAPANWFSRAAGEPCAAKATAPCTITAW